MNTVISIVLFIIILIALYKMYYIVNPDLLNKDGAVINIKRSPQMDIDITDLEDASGIRYFYDGWLMINETQSENIPYVIFNRGKDFIVSIKGHILSVVALSSGSVDKTMGTYTEGNSYKILDIATNFPFQKMTYFCINVDANQIDVYLNGKIAKSVKGNEIVNPKDGKPVDFTKFEKPASISVGNNYVLGSLARFRREPGNIDPQSVWTNYMLGPGVSTSDDSSSSDYHAKINITRNSKPRRTINLF